MKIQWDTLPKAAHGAVFGACLVVFWGVLSCPFIWGNVGPSSKLLAEEAGEHCHPA